MAAMLFAGCTSEQQIRKSALRYFKDGNSAFLHRDYQNAIWNYRKAITMDSETPEFHFCLLYTSPSPRDRLLSRMPSSA